MRYRKTYISQAEEMCAFLGALSAAAGFYLLLRFLGVEDVVLLLALLTTLGGLAMAVGFWIGVYIYHWIAFVRDVFAGMRDLYRRRQR